MVTRPVGEYLEQHLALERALIVLERKPAASNQPSDELGLQRVHRVGITQDFSETQKTREFVHCLPRVV